MQSLENISPIDGRYQNQTVPLKPFLSEAALMRYRVLVEVAYFKKLVHYPVSFARPFPPQLFILLDKIVDNFSIEDAEKIKEIEQTTNHDVKAIEYFIADKFLSFGLSDFVTWIHFGLTSQDINNVAVPLMLKDATHQVILPALRDVLTKLNMQMQQWQGLPMLARTHGQAASPTTLGKEWRVFHERLEKQINALEHFIFEGKFGGATGNFNAHAFVFPDINWIDFADELLSDLGLVRQQTTTQIEHYDQMAAFFDLLKRINTLLTDFVRDVWAYISMNYFTQTLKSDEVGSSAMPHKVNPIDFENAEGNLGLANAVAGFFATKLPVSRLQRDLTDSTVLRAISLPLGHSLIAYNSILKGLNKLQVNKIALETDLNNNWAVVAEAIQTKLRAIGYPKPYEALKDFSRGNHKLNQKNLHKFIDSLAIDEETKLSLKAVTPSSYLGIGH